MLTQPRSTLFEGRAFSVKRHRQTEHFSFGLRDGMNNPQRLGLWLCQYLRNSENRRTWHSGCFQSLHPFFLGFLTQDGANFAEEKIPVRQAIGVGTETRVVRPLRPV